MYLDTNLITSLIIKEDLFADYDKLLFNIEQYHEIVISQIVIGETLIKIIEKSTNKNNDVIEFTKFLIEKTKLKPTFLATESSRTLFLYMLVNKKLLVFTIHFSNF
jgi:predicted nucleic acid-binding protein